MVENRKLSMSWKYRRSKEYTKLDLGTRAKIWIRDKRKCILCGGKATEIHEIIPRSQFGNNQIEELFSEKNRCAICRNCHSNEVDTKIKIMNKLNSLYGYDYTVYPWSAYYKQGE